MSNGSNGYHHVEDVMGTTISIDVRDETNGEAPGLIELITWLHHVDRTFSTYLDDSPISRLGRGEVTLAETTEEIRGVLRRCEELRLETNGAFDVFAVPAPNGTDLDPSGYVKGWSVERGAAILEANGLANFCINAGGDIALRGIPLPDSAWRVGIRHPAKDQMLTAMIELVGPVAVATSATYERGAHIIDPRTGSPTMLAASVSIVGPDLATADAYATAGLVMAPDGLDWLTEWTGYEGLVVTNDGQQLTTAGFDALRASPPDH